MSDNEIKFAALSIWRAFRNGSVYGTKIRLPHAFVMTLLFRRNKKWRKMIDPICKLTWEHSRNLALFVGFYKTVLALARIIRLKLGDKINTPPGTPASQLDSFLAAAIVGHFVWGRYSAVNLQIVLYLMARVVFGLISVLKKNQVYPFRKFTFSDVYPYLASITWGAVLWLYEYHPECLQKSLFNSMEFLYHESNTWNNGIKDFLPSTATMAVFVYLFTRNREVAVP